MSSTHQVLGPCWAVYEERDWVMLSWWVSGLLPADISYWNKGSVNADLGGTTLLYATCWRESCKYELLYVNQIHNLQMIATNDSWVKCHGILKCFETVKIIIVGTGNVEWQSHANNSQHSNTTFTLYNSQGNNGSALINTKKIFWDWWLCIQIAHYLWMNNEMGFTTPCSLDFTRLLVSANIYCPPVHDH